MPTTERLKARGIRLRQAIQRRLSKRSFEAALHRDVPAQFHPAARFAFHHDMSDDETRVAAKIEGFRESLQQDAEATAAGYPSPRSGTFQRDESGHAVPAERTTAPLAAHAKTGADATSGVLLRRIVEGLAAGRVLELGTNTGFSGCYFLSAASQPELVTIEGSEDLSRIAEENLSQMGGRFTVMNCLFDEALDELVARGERFDCAYIDGQHEMAATLHYAERVAEALEPGGAIIFDDIYWSTDMNNAWKTLLDSGRYAVTCDFGSKGLGVLRVADEPTVRFDMGDYLARPMIGRKEW